MRWKSTDKPSEKVQCELTTNIFLHFSSDPRPFDIFEKAIDFNKLISHIICSSNKFVCIAESQNSCNFVTNDAEMKAFTDKYYWSSDKYIANQELRDAMIKSRFKEILHNIHFSDNETADSNNKGNKVRSLIDHFNEAF